MQRSMQATFAPADGVANSIALAQAPGAAGNLNLNGADVAAGVVTLDLPRRLAISSTGDESGKTFTITGTDRNGRSETEVIKGPAANQQVFTLKDYASGPLVVSINAASAGNVTVGTNGSFSSQWFVVGRDCYGVAFDVDLGGLDATYTVESTIADFYPPQNNLNVPTDNYFPPRGHPDFTNVNNSDSGSFSGLSITGIRITFSQFATGMKATFRVTPGGFGDG